MTNKKLLKFAFTCLVFLIVYASIIILLIKLSLYLDGFEVTQGD